MQPCHVCGHVYGQLHRLVPGEWGGTYEPGNIVPLCPNHHTAIHLLMKWLYHGLDTPEERERYAAYLDSPAERGLRAFWRKTVRPLVLARLEEEGRRPQAAARRKRLLAGTDRSAVLLKLLEAAGASGMTRTALSRATHGHIPSCVIRRHLADLAASGRAHVTRVATGAGRPTETWYVVRQGQSATG